MLRLRTFGGIWMETADGARLASPAPRRLAFLAILAAVGQRGISRSRLCAIFWPDSEDEPARHALRQTLYALRRDVGVTAVLADADLRLDPEVISSDIQDFRAAIGRRDWPAVDTLYQGPFADGFALEDAPEFNRWLDEERADIARQAAGALETLARDAATAADRRAAAQVWMRLTVLDPTSARYASSYMSALAAVGDRAAAIAHARNYTALIRRELDAEPDPEVVLLANALRNESAAPIVAEASTTAIPAQATPPPPTVQAEPPPSAVEPLPGRGPPRVAPRWLAGGGAVLAVIAAVAVAVAVRGRWSTDGSPVLAVGQLRDLTPRDSAWMGGVLDEVLATSLARLDVEVISNSRILELLPEGKDTVRAARSDAARRAGATEIVEGELVPGANGLLQLDLRRIDIARGTLRRGYSISGTDRFTLIDSATALLAADLRIGRPARALAEVTPRSVVALRLYEEGLRAFFRSETATARELFREALAEDSTFAMAAYYTYRTTNQLEGRDPALEALVLRLSTRAPDRDRLIIQTLIRTVQHDPVAPVIAETLAVRFPRDPEALTVAAEALTVHQLITDRERELFERAIAIDSVAGSNTRAPCRLCEALRSLGYRLQVADSIPAAEEVARRLVALRPLDPNPVMGLAMLQFSLGRYDAAIATLARLGDIPTVHPMARPVFLGRLLNGRLDEADEECRVNLGQGDPRVVGEYRWLCAIVWRNQGRYQDAAGLIFSGRLPGNEPLQVRLARDVVTEAILDYETGRPMAALRLFDSVAPKPAGGVPPGLFARELSWSLARRGTVAAMGREFELVRRLSDSLEVAGRGSLYGRDPRLHYFLRGLTAQASNDHQTAADFFRRSIFSWNSGYTRANLELARSLLVLGRAPEAIEPLQSALRGGLEGSNLYVTRTELHELLAQAFAAAGRRDSAVVHYDLVERAWRRADPPFAARYQAARDYLTRFRAERP